MRPDGLKVLVGNARFQPFTIAVRSLGGIGTEREIDLMEETQGSGLAS
jgi:hypothetical protein